MDYLQHSNRYKSIINDYQHNRDKYPSHYIYELLWGLDLGLIHWDDIPPGFEDIYKLPHRRDYGIDLISLEYNKTAQVKEYNGKKPITWSDMTNYTTYSKDILEITDMTLATTPIAKIDSMVTRLFQQEERKIVRKSFDELMSTVMENYNPDNDNPTTAQEIEERTYLLDCFQLITTTDKDNIKLQLPCGNREKLILCYTQLEMSYRKILIQNPSYFVHGLI